MTQSSRKLLGTVITLVVLVVYAGIATAIYTSFLEGAPNWLLLIYFAAAGLFWAVPVGFVIRWMVKPDD
jgi:hypothetical protein